MRRFLFLCIVVGGGVAVLADGVWDAERRLESLLDKELQKKRLDVYEKALVVASRLRRVKAGDAVEGLCSALAKVIREEERGWVPPELISPVKLQTKRYYVGDLINSQPDQKIPEMGLARILEDSEDEETGESEEDFFCVSDDALVDALGVLAGDSVRDYCRTKEYAEMESANTVAVRTDSVGHKQVKALIEGIRRFSSRKIWIHYRFLKCSPELLLALTRDGPQMTPNKEAVLRQAVAGKKAVYLARGSVVATNGQRVSHFAGRQITYLGDYDINTSGMPVLQPVMRIFNSGFICAFRPYLMRDGRVLLRVRVCQSALDGTPRKAKFVSGEYEKPSIVVELVAANVPVVAGRWFVVGGAAGSKRGFSAILLVCCQPSSQ